MDSMLDIRQMFGILRKHLLLIVLSMIGVAVVAFGVAEFVMTPKYESTAQILVNQKHDEANSAAALQTQQADVQMISTYKDIITNQVVLKKVSHNLKNPTKVITPAKKAKYKTLADGTKRLVRAAKPAVTENSGKKYDMSVTDLKDAISITNQQNSQVFALNIKTDDPDKSAAVANEISAVFKSKIKSIMSVNNVTIVSKATADTQKASPNVKLFVAAGAIIGLLLSVAYAFAVELTDTTVRDDEFLVRELGLINLGQVAEIHLSNKEQKSVVSSQSSHSRSGSRRVRV